MTETPKKPRSRPEIVNFGKRQFISTQQFNTPLVADKLITDAVNEWFSVIDIAKFAYGKAMQADRQRVRKNIWALRRELLRRGFLLIHEGRPVENVKIYVRSPLETQIALTTLLKMRTRTDISADLYAKAESIVNEEERKAG